MPSAERPSQLINPYASEPDPVEESAGPARVAGRALVIGTLGIGAAAALTGTGFADDFGSFDFDSSDTTSYDIASTDTSLSDSSSYGSGSGDTGTVDFSPGEQLSYAAPVEQIVAAEPVEPVWGSDVPAEPVEPVPVEPVWGSDVPAEPVPVEPVGPLWSSDSGGSDSGAVAQLQVPDAPVEPVWGSDVPGAAVEPVRAPVVTLPEVSFPETYRDHFIKTYSVPEHPYGLDEDTDASFRGNPEVVAPQESSSGSVLEANWSGFNNGTPADSGRPLFYNTPGSADTPDTSSYEPTGIPTSPLIMAMAVPSAPLLLRSDDDGLDSGDVALLPGSAGPAELRLPGNDLDVAVPVSSGSPFDSGSTFDRLPGYEGDVDVSTLSFTDRSQLNSADDIRGYDDGTIGSGTFGQVAPRGDYSSYGNDYLARNIPTDPVPLYRHSTPHRTFVASSGPANPLTDARPYQPPTIDRGRSVGSGPASSPRPAFAYIPDQGVFAEVDAPQTNSADASGQIFGTGNTSLVDRLQIPPGGPSPAGEFFRGSSLVGAAAPDLPTVDPVRPGMPLKSEFKLVSRYDTKTGQLFVGPEGAVVAEGSGQVPGTGLFWTGKLDASGRGGVMVGDSVSPVFQAKVSGDASLATGRNMTGFFGRVEGDANVNYANQNLNFGGNLTGRVGYGWTKDGNISAGYRVSSADGNSGPVARLNVPLTPGLSLQADYSHTPDSGHRGVVQVAFDPFAKPDRAQTPGSRPGLAAPVAMPTSAPGVSTWSLPPGEVAVVRTQPTTVASSGTSAGALGGTSGLALAPTTFSPSLVASSGPRTVSPVDVGFSSLPVTSPTPSPALVSSSDLGPVASNDFGSTTFGTSGLGAGFLSSSSLGSGFGF